MTGKDVLWSLDPHSSGKHEVLRHYLGAWYPILASVRDRILFIDGFAGPGEYVKGEEGSPIIALKTFLTHKANINAEVRFIFIEKDPSIAAHLEALLSPLRSTLPTNCRVDPVVIGAFDEKMTDLLGLLDVQGKAREPSFVMIDPFGVSDTPMEVIGRILKSPRSEVYISFMYEWVNRFMSTPQFEPKLTALFGTEEWRKALRIADSERRKAYLFDLYGRQLRAHGARQVVHFDVYEGHRLVYAVFFASGHWKGAEKMKKAIWDVVPAGDFAFHGTRSPQLSLRGQMVDFSPLRDALLKRFGGKGWITVEAAEEFVGSDETDFHLGHLRKNALIPMEDAGRLEVQRPRPRKHSYSAGTRLQFK